MARRFLSFESILNNGRVSVFFRCKPWAISLADAGALLICRKRNMLSGLRCEGLGMGIASERRCYFSTVILVTFFGSSGTFFRIPGLYRQANTRPAIRPPSEWPVPREGKIKEAGRPGPPPSFILVLSLDTNHLVQSVDDLHQIALRRHDRFDGLVGRGRFVDDLGILTAFDARRHALVVFHGESP